ncbi:TetR/AcrR family transcriptional regulator [Nonomuraea longispora]|uniref:TetR/AcrR family transcriptional regulator n=1 Tax=Nonomuraea longispora TaxID=1848320 RepID=A0A4R4N3E4_9ACTN|nr:TetR/AcrR family transcriptional regulator [Nonomuraea longispora]TDC03281.1 TetR/AcrR family transcriptional regulator [Nonomuraea longispora]
MAKTTPGVTRERLLDEAIRLFARRGYGATSVADIQQACGLAGGSGALYKHFPSKQALLEAAVRRNLGTMALRRQEVVERIPDDPRETLLMMARAVWDVIDGDKDLVRIMLREFTVFPEIFEPMWQGVLATLYRECAAWIAAQRESGVVETADPEATAAVLISSLTYFPLLNLLIGHTPGDLGEETFLEAWTEHAARTLALRPGRNS